jgi:biotin transport system substrate-specific component
MKGGNMFSFKTYVDSATLKWEGAVNVTLRIFLSLLFAGITGACARLRIYLPFTPVPVTAQVFAVILSGALLGKEYGSLSQLFYITLGIFGIPWFVIGPLGPTGGYLLGFIVAPYLIGFILEKCRRKHYMAVFLSMLAGVSLIYIFGLLHFTLFTKQSIIRSFPQAVLPFIPFDILKAAAAAGTAGLVLKRVSKKEPKQDRVKEFNS